MKYKINYADGRFSGLMNQSFHIYVSSLDNYIDTFFHNSFNFCQKIALFLLYIYQGGYKFKFI